MKTCPSNSFLNLSRPPARAVKKIMPDRLACEHHRKAYIPGAGAPLDGPCGISYALKGHRPLYTVWRMMSMVNRISRGAHKSEDDDLWVPRDTPRLLEQSCSHEGHIKWPSACAELAFGVYPWAPTGRHASRRRLASTIPILPSRGCHSPPTEFGMSVRRARRDR